MQTFFSQVSESVLQSVFHAGREWSRFWQEEDPTAQFIEPPRKTSKSQFLTPEEDVKKLIISAQALDDVWEFLIKRLRSGAEPRFILLSVVDEVAELLRLKYLWPQRMDCPFQGEFIPLCDTANHLVKTVLRSDTTFSNQLLELGRELYPYVDGHDQSQHHIFSIPFMAGNKTMAVITLGFDTVDAFSQAKLSYIYLLRDQLAQLIWNLILQDRIQQQPQIDNLTGLITHSSFHHAYQMELKRAQLTQNPLSLMLLDINQLKIYNQHHGHAMGDQAIAWLASVVKHDVRGIDSVARYGNDQIAVILPETEAQDAELLANRIVSQLKNPPIGIAPFNVCVAIGAYPVDQTQPDALIQVVENTLEFAKHQSLTSQTSVILLSQALQDASDNEMLNVVTAQISRKYGQTHSELFDTLVQRIDTTPSTMNEDLMLQTVRSFVTAFEAKSPYHKGHAQAVSDYSVALAQAAGLAPTEVEQIRLAGYLHDIGMIGIPEAILNKEGPLTEVERMIMEQHPVIGARQILQPVDSLQDIVPLVEYHHERWDGKGYPAGLKGENIPVGARIISIVDAFHAMTAERSYRYALALDEALVLLQDGAGAQWDPFLMGLFFELLNKTRVPAMEARLIAS